MKYPPYIFAFALFAVATIASAEEVRTAPEKTKPVEATAPEVVWAAPPVEVKTAPEDVEWLSTQVQMPPLLAPPLGLNISSDGGRYQYEALEQGAEKTLQPEPIPQQHMAGRKPMIAIVIDDMGLDRVHSARATRLPAGVTLSYLPYSQSIGQQTGDARKAGHELMLHLPMQPERKTADPGPGYLGVEMAPLALHERVIKNLDAFAGYTGVNNHMGSKFTKDRDGLAIVMAALAERKMMFLDSRTAPGSIAEKIAREHGMKATHRDVFLDDDTAPSSVARSLIQVEQVARRAGAAIAIGHPKDVTLAALEKWLPTLAAKGFELVPVSQVITLRNAPKVVTGEVKPQSIAKATP
ncbi:MAG: divergent polysaccharide deacetylase family protein [bacterium]|nr:divergent polysaccharide deacetylase family protein [bacterium]